MRKANLVLLLPCQVPLTAMLYMHKAPLP